MKRGRKFKHYRRFRTVEEISAILERRGYVTSTKEADGYKIIVAIKEATKVIFLRNGEIVLPSFRRETCV